MKITPCIWMDNEAEEAANFYVSIFPNSKITQIDKRLTEDPSNKPIGSVLTVLFEIDGMEFMLLNGGPEFKPNEAISFSIPASSQEEIDMIYQKLSADPNAEICGWLKDKYGVSWQINPPQYYEIMKSEDEAKKKRMMDKILQMKRLNLKELMDA